MSSKDGRGIIWTINKASPLSTKDWNTLDTGRNNEICLSLLTIFRTTSRYFPTMWTDVVMNRWNFHSRHCDVMKLVFVLMKRLNFTRATNRWHHSVRVAFLSLEYYIFFLSQTFKNITLRLFIYYSHHFNYTTISITVFTIILFLLFSPYFGDIIINFHSSVSLTGRNKTTN